MPRIAGRERRSERLPDRASDHKVLWIFALLLLVLAYGYARFDTYVMDGDGTAFLDIAEGLNTHHAFLALNGYWNPGYPAVLALAERVTHPGLWRELAVVRYTNILIFALAMAGTLFFTRSLTRARTLAAQNSDAVLSAPLVDLLGLALLGLSLGRELPVAAPRSDTLLYTLLIFSGGLLVRLLDLRPPFWLFPALGVSLGLGYLTKSFAFLPSLAVFAVLGLVALRRRGTDRVRTLLGTGLAALCFAALAGPYMLAISRQLGHFSTGESARLNYAFFVDLTPRWHEAFHGDLGHAGGPFLHPEAVLSNQPPTFSYAAHPRGTYPLWFDPAYWTLGLKPHVWLKGHLLRFARNVALFARYLLGRPEVFVLLAVLFAAGATLPRWRARDDRPATRLWTLLDCTLLGWALLPLGWGLLMLAIYFPVDLQDRYLTAPFLLTLLPLFALLRSRAADSPSSADNAPSSAANIQTGAPVQAIARALVLLFAFLIVSQAVTYIAERRRHIPPAEHRHPGYDPQIFTAAAALDHLGLHPGDKIACMGDLACYTDHYWARVAGVQILGEIETPGEANPIDVWNAMPDPAVVTAPLTAMGLRYIVSLFPNSGSKPRGWVQLGRSNFFAYPLQGQTVSPSESASFRPTP